MGWWLSIIALCGLIGAGKTTLASRLRERLGDARIISTDLLGRGAYEKMLCMVTNQRGSERYLILDATFYKSSWRDRLAEVARERVVIIYLKCSLKTSLSRNREREEPLPDSAVYSIYRSFDLPKDPDILVDADNMTPEEAESIVVRFLENFRLGDGST